MKAFPVIPTGQEHINIRLKTLQSARCPQAPGQGSLHLFLIQALVDSQSVL